MQKRHLTGSNTHSQKKKKKIPVNEYKEYLQNSTANHILNGEKKMNATLLRAGGR